MPKIKKIGGCVLKLYPVMTWDVFFRHTVL